ncbi:unnamed protein product [Orchesella dallaii]|uniref:Condensin complex subunit 2 n=1 Tax=Orchesella dallaii TaxID=48710 RepID=A0ABP1PTC0_9HEXA
MKLLTKNSRISDREAENESVMRASTTRKSNAPIPLKVPSKMPSNTRRRVLADFNMQHDRDEEEVVVKPGKNVENGNVSGPVLQCKAKKAVLPNSSSTDEETSRSDKRIILRLTIDGYGERKINGQSGRTKRRSSIPLRNSGSGTDRDSKTSSDTGIAASITGGEGINAQHAFKLRLLDYINGMINSPNYDKSNMQLTSSTLEIGTKIFVCQVDNTRSQVLSLGSEIMLRKRHKKKEEQEQGNIGREQPKEDRGDADFDDDEVAGRCQKQNKKTIKKRGKFVEEDNSKLLTGLEARGQPLNDADGMREAEILEDPLVPVDADFAYNPEDRPAEYPEELEPKYLNDTFNNGLVNENTNSDENGIIPVSFKHIPDLDCLDEYFQRVKGLIKESRSKFCWCGPNFVKPKQSWTVIQRPKIPKFRKEPEPIDFCKIDWAEQNRKFNERIAEAARTKKENKTIVTLRAGKIIIPYHGLEYEYDFDPVDFENENDAKYVPPIFRLFTNSNQNILDLLTKKAQENASFHYEDDGLANDNMLPKPSSNHSIESRLENEHDDQFPQRDYNALNECKLPITSTCVACAS